MTTANTIPTTFLAYPVINSRQWTTGLAPNGSGGWNFIVQSYNYPSDEPVEWVVVDLENDTYTVDAGPNRAAANTNFQIDTALQANGQARASDGRIFFPQISPDETSLYVAYYDPADEHVHQITFNDTTGSHNSAVFSFVFNQSGSMCYGGTQAPIGYQPTVFSLDPSTLATTVIGNVGVAASVQPRYCYYLAKDEAPGSQYLYAAVGQEVWELVSINVNTGVQTVLYTTTGPAQQFISFDAIAAQGWRVQIIDNGVSTYYWLADGAISAYPGGGSPPGGARDVTPYENPIVNPPDVDYSLGIEYVAWRPYGSSGDYTIDTYEVTYKGPVQIETLSSINDDLIFGNTLQYNGFWQYTISSATLEWLGPGSLSLVSQPALTPVDATNYYFSGYANGVLYHYDPTAAWNPLDPGGQPELLGYFHNAGGVGSNMKYAYFMVRCSTNGKLYCCGRRERDAIGSAIASYDPATTTFAGSNAAPLDDYEAPRGWLVLEDLARVVFSGKVGGAAFDAQFLLYDYDLNLVDQQTLKAGVTDSGLIFDTAVPGVIVGVAPAAGAVYKFDLNTGTLLEWEPQAGTIGSQTATQDDDGNVWFTLGYSLMKIEPASFTITEIGTFDIVLDTAVALLKWIGGRLYLANNTQLRLVGLHQMNRVNLGAISV